MGNFRARHRLSFVVLAGLLSGCPGVDLGDTPTDINLCNPAGGIDYFVSDIYPTFMKAEMPGDAKSCASANTACHKQGDGTAFNLKTGAARDDVFNFRQAQQFLNCGTREMSILLTRPLDTSDPHGGGDIYSETSPEHQLFLDWFE